MLYPLVGFESSSPVGSPEVGALATVLLYTAAGDKAYGARIERVEHGLAWVKVIGLSVEWPYMLGDQITVSLDKVIDWS